MADRAFEPKQGRIRDSGGRTNLTTARRVLTQAGRAGAGIVRQRGHIAPDARRRGTAPGLFARAGIMIPPCGVPVTGWRTVPSTMMPAFRKA
jgi:hypothetical protein